MHIEKISLHRFKKYKDKTVELSPLLSLVAGANNSGKTTILQAFSVWEFCKTILEIEKGPESLRIGYKGQGLGIGSDEFSPLNIQSPRHLWTNLNPQKEKEPDGYTLWIELHWSLNQNPRHLRIALSLANDRIFIKTTSTNVEALEPIPHTVYIPPFAGIKIKEEKSSPAQQRRYIGQGLPGATLRSMLLEIYNENIQKREELKGEKQKIADRDLIELRKNDAWEILQHNLREVFNSELSVRPYNDEFHTHIKIWVHKGKLENGKFSRFKKFSERDLTAEGSGFLQWLSVLTFVLSEKNHCILLDEPDAHLHTTLQTKIVTLLNEISQLKKKQILFCTHSPELIRTHPFESILSIDEKNIKYLSSDMEKVSSLAGIGSAYHPLLDKTKELKKILFVENTSDADFLFKAEKILEEKIQGKFVVWPWPSKGSERKHLFSQLKKDIPELICISLNDRDDDSIANIDPSDLRDISYKLTDDLHHKKWRRRYIECYLMHPDPIARALEKTTEEIIEFIRKHHAIDISGRFTNQVAEPQAILDIRAKEIISGASKNLNTEYGFEKYKTLGHFTKDEIHVDIKIMILEIKKIFKII
jgi:predicted ATPase